MHASDIIIGIFRDEIYEILNHGLTLRITLCFDFPHFQQTEFISKNNVHYIYM